VTVLLLFQSKDFIHTKKEGGAGVDIGGRPVEFMGKKEGGKHKDSAKPFQKRSDKRYVMGRQKKVKTTQPTQKANHSKRGGGRRCLGPPGEKGTYTCSRGSCGIGFPREGRSAGRLSFIPGKRRGKEKK